MSIRDWHFGLARICGFRKCDKSFVDPQHAAPKHYCCKRHSNAERVARHRDNHKRVLA